MAVTWAKRKIRQPKLVGNLSRKLERINHAIWWLMEKEEDKKDFSAVRR